MSLTSSSFNAKTTTTTTTTFKRLLADENRFITTPAPTFCITEFLNNNSPTTLVLNLDLLRTLESIKDYQLMLEYFCVTLQDVYNVIDSTSPEVWLENTGIDKPDRNDLFQVYDQVPGMIDCELLKPNKTLTKGGAGGGVGSTNVFGGGAKSASKTMFLIYTIDEEVDITKYINGTYSNSICVFRGGFIAEWNFDNIKLHYSVDQKLVQRYPYNDDTTRHGPQITLIDFDQQIIDQGRACHPRRFFLPEKFWHDDYYINNNVDHYRIWYFICGKSVSRQDFATYLDTVETFVSCYALQNINEICEIVSDYFY